MEYKGTLKITAHKGYLILTLMNKGPKVKAFGVGTMLSNFNDADVYISEEALVILKNNVMQNMQLKDPVLEIIAKDRLWWSSTTGIIIPPGELLHLYVLPHHTMCANEVDHKLKELIDGKK